MSRRSEITSKGDGLTVDGRCPNYFSARFYLLAAPSSLLRDWRADVAGRREGGIYGEWMEQETFGDVATDI